jgi:hypothetical protein
VGKAPFQVSTPRHRLRLSSWQIMWRVLTSDTALVGFDICSLVPSTRRAVITQDHIVYANQATNSEGEKDDSIIILTSLSGDKRVSPSRAKCFPSYMHLFLHASLLTCIPSYMHPFLHRLYFVLKWALFGASHCSHACTLR